MYKVRTGFIRMYNVHTGSIRMYKVHTGCIRMYKVHTGSIRMYKNLGNCQTYEHASHRHADGNIVFLK